MDKPIEILKGTIQKFQVVWEYPSDRSVTLDSIDATLEVWVNNKLKMSIDKNDLYHEDDDWFVYVDTKQTGVGRLKFRLLAEIPDLHAPGGVKKDYVEDLALNALIYE